MPTFTATTDYIMPIDANANVSFTYSEIPKEKQVERDTILRLKFPKIDQPVEISSDGSVKIGCNSMTAKESKMLMRDLAKVHGFKLSKK